MPNGHRGAPRELILLVRDACSIDLFVETGTFRAATAVWASSHFSHVVTIENSAPIHAEALRRYGHIGNIDFLSGNSRNILEQVSGSRPDTAIYWLDAHWSGGETYGDNDECPLLDEIAVINRRKKEDVILIDDARLFLSPPPRPHKIENWPSIDAVVDALRDRSVAPYIVINDDVIVAVPGSIKDRVATYCQDRTTRQWHTPGARALQALLAPLNQAKRLFAGSSRTGKPPASQ
ncbi:MAG: hypothetical protein OEW15_16650 [Nitrospirota bacterium]|nr:hypothetical protein [Nitrospirota bacterium]